MKLLIRILLSPFILIFTFLVLLFSSVPLALALGLPEAIYYLIINKKNVDWTIHFYTTFFLIWYPVYLTIIYIKGE